jgi:small subunit ribosomal protein S9
VSEMDNVVEVEVEETVVEEEQVVEETSFTEDDEPFDGSIVEQVYATGRRKSAIARVWLRRGKGRFSINKLSLDDYFNRETQRMIVKQPMRLTKNLNDFDVMATVKGGGKSSQADAVKLGISKALVQFNTDENRPVLKKSGFLTRDPRMKERKKYGQRGARARFQFSKR